MAKETKVEFVALIKGVKRIVVKQLNKSHEYDYFARTLGEAWSCNKVITELQYNNCYKRIVKA